MGWNHQLDLNFRNFPINSGICWRWSYNETWWMSSGDNISLSCVDVPWQISVVKKTQGRNPTGTHGFFVHLGWFRNSSMGFKGFLQWIQWIETPPKNPERRDWLSRLIGISKSCKPPSPSDQENSNESYSGCFCFMLVHWSFTVQTGGLVRESPPKSLNSE